MAVMELCLVTSVASLLLGAPCPTASMVAMPAANLPFVLAAVTLLLGTGNTGHTGRVASSQ